MTHKEIEVKERDEKLQLVIEHIRKNSALGKFTMHSDLLDEPINLEEEEIEEIIETLKVSEEYGDLKELKGKKGSYLYSKLEMTENYAKILFRIEEKDILRLVAETIRFDSKKYPRTTSMNTFYSNPFYFSKEEFKSIIEQLQSKEEYKDIKESKASNGVVHLYSDLYLTQDYANALTEWIEVSMDE